MKKQIIILGVALTAIWCVLMYTSAKQISESAQGRTTASPEAEAERLYHKSIIY